MTLEHSSENLKSQNKRAEVESSSTPDAGLSLLAVANGKTDLSGAFNRDAITFPIGNSPARQDSNAIKSTEFFGGNLDQTPEQALMKQTAIALAQELASLKPWSRTNDVGPQAQIMAAAEFSGRFNEKQAARKSTLRMSTDWHREERSDHMAYVPLIRWSHQSQAPGAVAQPFAVTELKHSYNVPITGRHAHLSNIPVRNPYL